MKEQNFIRFETEKANVYNIFTALLCQPSEDLVLDLTVYDRLKSALEIVNPDCIEFVDEMQNKIQTYTPLEILVEYTRLFIGPFKVLTHQYSCMYFGGKSLMSDETIWVINYYEKMGLQFDQSIKDAPDHVAVETEFIYYMLFNELKNIEEGNSKKAIEFWKGQSEFFTKHYKKWIPSFCESIITETKNEYYKAFAECLSKFVSTVKTPKFPKLLEIEMKDMI